MNHLIPICIVIGIVIVGHVSKRIDLNKIKKRTYFTANYRHKLIELLNDFMSGNGLKQDLYYELTMDVNSMQRELGTDGVAHVQDNLIGFRASNYLFLVNFLPEIRNMQNDLYNSILMTRFDQSAKTCDDMLVRHLGTLKELDKLVRKNLFNPFSCFADGIKSIVSLPILILNWFGLISDEHVQKASQSRIIKILNFIAVLLGVVSAIVTIALGWDDFLQLILK